MDSPLQMPQVRSLPEPDSARPPLPPPRLAAVPPAAVAREFPAAAFAGANPQPPLPPPLPSLAPIAPPPPSRAPATAAPTAGTTVAMLDRLDRAQLQRVAARYHEEAIQQAVRVIAYAAAPVSGADPLGGYHAALERAKAVAKALSEAGIPADKIQTEASPASATTAAARVEIQFLP
jgi:hypothetical protein